MSLISSTLSKDFYTLARQVQKTVPKKPTTTEFNSIVIVGAADSLGQLSSTEESLISTALPSIVKNGLIPSTDELQVSLCDLNNDSDLLTEEVDCDLLILSSLLYAPEKEGLKNARYSKQSLYADIDEAWVSAFQNSNASAILNVSYNWDRKSANGLNRLLDLTVEYRKIETEEHHKNFNTDFKTLNKIASLYARKI